jgi:hypothetical protein
MFEYVSKIYPVNLYVHLVYLDLMRLSRLFEVNNYVAFCLFLLLAYIGFAMM